MAYRQANTITTTDYNTFLNTVNSVYGVGAGDRGYGQTAINQTVVDTTKKITALQWANLRAMTLTAATHQGTASSTLPPAAAYTAAQLIKAFPAVAHGDPYDIETVISAIDANRMTAAPANMTLSVGVHTSSMPSTWSSSITTIVEATFASEDAARFFFNSGGEIRLRLSHPNGTSNQDVDWRSILTDKIGTITFKAHGTTNTGTVQGSQNVGYYEVGTSDTTLYDGTNIGSGLYASNDVTITARVLDRAAVRGGNGRIVQFKIVLNDEHTNVYSDVIQAGTAVTFDLYRATYLQGITSPTFTTSTAFGGSAVYVPVTWSTPAGNVGSSPFNGAFNIQLVANGGSGPRTYTVISGALPTGVTLSSGSGLIVGTTTASPGIYTFTARVTDGTTQDDRTFAVSVTNAAPIWNTPSGTLGTYLVGSQVTATLSATDPEGQPVLYYTSNTLTNGITLNPAGTFSGTITGYTSNGTTNFTVRANDGVNDVFRDFSISHYVNPPPPLPTFSTRSVFDYTGFDQVFTVPQNVYYIKVKCWGAGGGGAFGEGGVGGYTEGIMSVLPGQVYTVVVGQGGWYLASSSSGSFYNGGSVNATYYGAGGRAAAGGFFNYGGIGGGLSGLFMQGNVTRAGALFIAGGGGGGGGHFRSLASDSAKVYQGGNGNDPSHAGGQGTLAGADGATAGLTYSCGGGGGGFAGGNTGQSRDGSMGQALYPGYGAGEGGSGYTVANASSTLIAYTPEFSKAVPGSSDADYDVTIGKPQQYYYTTGGTAGFPAGNGRVVIRW